MSKNLFKKNNNNLRKTTNNELKSHGLGIFNPLANEKVANPVTLISKNRNKDNYKDESSKEQKAKKELALLRQENRNLSKKAKAKPPQSVSGKKANSEINKTNNIDADNKNNDFMQKVEKKLRDNSNSKSGYKKKQKENDYLRCAININVDFDLNDNEETKNDQNKDINTINLKHENNMINPETNNNTRKSHMSNNPNILKCNEEKVIKDKTKNNESCKINENDIAKQVQRKSYSKQNVYQSLNKNPEPKYNRSSIKKHTYQSHAIFNEKNTTPFTFERKQTFKNQSNKESSSLKSSIVDSINRTNSLRKSINSSGNSIIIPLLNRTKENNCFLNVIIQVLFQLTEYKKELLDINKELSNNSRTIKEFYDLLNSYRDEQIKNKDNKNQIEAVLSVNSFKEHLNNIYKCFRPGEPGDPMETLQYIFDLIHRIYNKRRGINYKKVENCKCPSHKFFLLKLVDIISCPYCNAKKIQMYNKDCFMFDVLIKELTNKLRGKSFSSYKFKLFSKLKEHNETYENENKIKLPGCECNSKRLLSYEKKLKLNGPSSTYLIINIAWAEEYPSMIEMLTAYGLIPISEPIENLFTFAEDIKPKINDIFYIKSIILYGLYHYVCVLYIKEQKRWAIIDDKTIKYINKYYDLIDSLLRNHLMPVGIIYSKDRNDEISDSELKSYSISKEEYNKLCQFCKEVDTRRGLKVSDIIISKGSFNENNQNYLNNNFFYNSIIDLFPIDNDNNKQNMFNNVSTSKKSNNILSKTQININKLTNKDNNGSDKHVDIYNKDNNIDVPSNNKNEFLNGRKFLGDFSERNLKGGILVLSSSSLNDNNENNEKSQAKEENNFFNFGEKYEDN